MSRDWNEHLFFKKSVDGHNAVCRKPYASEGYTGSLLSGGFAGSLKICPHTLTDLKEQEKFIQANGHLEGVPSEAEVMNEGYDITKMDANLLRKIEELYLYTIALQKTVDAQKNDIESLKKQLGSTK